MNVVKVIKHFALSIVLPVTAAISVFNPPLANCTVHSSDLNKIIKQCYNCYEENAGGFCIYLFSQTHARITLTHARKRHLLLGHDRQDHNKSKKHDNS